LTGEEAKKIEISQYLIGQTLEQFVEVAALAELLD
jgi:hypothetical protein